MDLSAVDRRLQDIRAKGDVDLNDAEGVISDAFTSNPPHRVGIAHLMLRPRFLLLDPTGTGKMVQAVIACALLRSRNPHFRVVICATKSSLYQWVEAFQLFAPRMLAPIVLPGLGRLTRADIYADQDLPVVVGTYATIAQDIAASRLRSDQFAQRVLIFDEVQALRGANQMLLRPALSTFGEEARYVWGITATLFYSSIKDVWGIVDVVRPGTFGDLNNFLSTYALRRWNGFGYEITGSKNVAQLDRFLRPMVLKRPLSVFEGYLPTVRVQEYRVELSHPERALYRALKRGLREHTSPYQGIAHLQYAIDCPDALDKIGTPIPLDLPRRPAKFKELERLLLEEFATDSVLVFTRYTTVADRLVTWLREAGIGTASITGTEPSAAKREAAKNGFQQRAPSHRVLVLTTAGSEALNLQTGSVVICYDVPFGAGAFNQLIGRVRRHGSRHASVLVVLLIVEKTVDAATLARMRDQLTTSKSLSLKQELSSSPTHIHTHLSSSPLSSSEFSSLPFDLDLDRSIPSSLSCSSAGIDDRGSMIAHDTAGDRNTEELPVGASRKPAASVVDFQQALFDALLAEDA